MDRILLSLSRLTVRSDSLSISDARESLAFWSRRADTLPWHRRAARREARQSRSTARARLVGAHLEHARLGAFAPGVTEMLDTGASRYLRWLAYIALRRTPIGRTLMLAAGAFVLAAAGTATVTIALVIAIAS